MSQGHPLQIVTIDSNKVTEAGDVLNEVNSFNLIKENLEEIISKVPKDIKVSVVAVVGAFRTGKSFLLNFFLRYLRHGDVDDLSEDWMIKDGLELSEGNMNEGNTKSTPTVEDDQGNTSSSFAWRGGQERQTTGIWAWSEPFIRKCQTTGSDMAVILIDTQGMFDSETSMSLTAQIFGLSTFVSSYQIYNIDKRLQEDNLQHLALFSEYGRLALSSNPSSNSNNSSRSPGEVEKPSITSDDDSVEQQQGHSEGVNAASIPTDYRHTTLNMNSSKPFQRVQFLVRDWQNFSQDWPEEQQQAAAVYTALRGEMTNYLESVLKPRGLQDLQSTRDQITRCFESIDCFLLPHPGAAVTKRTFSGAISQIDPFFRGLINQYVREIFDGTLLTPKVINGREINARELQTYFQVYVRTFQTSNRSFPKAMTLLDATAEANNRNAFQHAMEMYKSTLNGIVGNETVGYQPEEKLYEVHSNIEKEVLNTFDELASLGAESVIQEFRNKLQQQVQAEWLRFKQTNRLKNPFLELERYVLPVGIAVTAWLLATLLDQICTSDHCEFVEDTFERLYIFVAFGVLAYAYTQNIKDAHMYTIPLGVAAASWFVAAVINTSCTTESCVKAGSAFQRVYLFIGFALLVLMYKNYSGAFSYIQNTLLPMLNSSVAAASNDQIGSSSGGGSATQKLD